jgi:hypothetical protein
MFRQNVCSGVLLRGSVLFLALAFFPSPARADFHLIGDFDCNYSVDLTDLSILLANFGSPGTSTTGDLDGNLLVELVDLALFLPNFGDRGCCAADLDGDSVIGTADMAILISNFPTDFGATRTDGDLDGDGDVDQADLDRMLCAQGRTCCHDVNGDGTVNLDDVAIVLQNHGLMTGATFEQGDVNCDGAVTDADVGLVTEQMGGGC